MFSGALDKAVRQVVEQLGTTRTDRVLAAPAVVQFGFAESAQPIERRCLVEGDQTWIGGPFLRSRIQLDGRLVFILPKRGIAATKQLIGARQRRRADQRDSDQHKPAEVCESGHSTTS